MFNNAGMKICRLCLKQCENTYEMIEESTTKILDALLIKVDLSISDEPVICKRCTGSIEEIFKFKSACLQIESYINLFINEYNSTELDLIELYSCKNEIEVVKIPGCHVPCRLCMKLTKRNCSASLNDDTEDMVSIKSILEKCLPELNLNCAKKSSVCMSCYLSLQTYHRFVSCCLDTEDKIKIYCEVESSNVKNQVVLNSVFEFMLTKLKCKNNRVETSAAETVRENGAYGKVDSKQETSMQMKSEELDIKHEDVNIKSACSDLDRHEDNEDNPLCLQQEANDILTQRGYPEEKLLEPETDPHTTNENSSNLTSYKCQDSADETKYKEILTTHLPDHRATPATTAYRCSTCAFETKNKFYLKQHTLVHKDAAEMATYQCSICIYVTKRKPDLAKHMVIHKDSSQVTMYKCKLCTFETRHKYYLRKHAEVHRDASEVTKVKCQLCRYEGKDKKLLKQHTTLVHGSSGASVCKCGICGNEFKCKSYLKKHMLMHADVSESSLYTCNICGHATKYKSSLRLHNLVHKESSEIPMYKCETCSYKTRYKQCVRRHMMRHKENGGKKLSLC